MSPCVRVECLVERPIDVNTMTTVNEYRGWQRQRAAKRPKRGESRRLIQIWFARSSIYVEVERTRTPRILASTPGIIDKRVDSVVSSEFVDICIENEMCQVLG